MGIDTFIRVELDQKKYAQHSLQEEKPIFRWMHNHPRAVKSAEVAIFAFGTYLINCGLNNYYSKGLSFALGSTSMVVSSVAYKILDFFAPPTHELSHHVFEPATCEGASLVYQGDIPVLTITTDDSFKAGYGHGFLLADQIYKIRETNSFVLHTLAREPRHTALIKSIETVKKLLPQEYIDEINGLVKGYNEKRKHWRYVKGSPLTVEEIILLHLLPDKLHLELKEMENWLTRESNESAEKTFSKSEYFPMGCTTVIDGNSLSGPVVGRNLDWSSLGIYGTYSLIVQRESKDGKKTIDLGFPSFLGTLTGMNHHGLCVAMNVCRGETDYIEGIPASFYNRVCLENNRSVEDVGEFIKSHRPLGPYHLSVTDKKDSMTVHFFQDKGKDFVRSWDKEEPLVTTNFRYGPKGRTRPTPTNSEKREETVAKYFDDLKAIGGKEESDPVKWIEKALSLPKVNSIRNIHSVVMHPESLTLKLSFDNGWAASLPRQEIATKKWFEN